jgi:DNA modification methylase
MKKRDGEGRKKGSAKRAAKSSTPKSHELKREQAMKLTSAATTVGAPAKDAKPPMNHLYYGDNIDILRRYVKEESIDLIYLDPPFNSNASYNVLFAAKDGTQAAAQIQAFEDTWHWDEAAARAFDETVTGGGPVANALLSFEKLIGRNDMLAYLAMMAPRLQELHRVLKSTGSLYLHCDPTASHYLKLLLDAVFEATSFRNEIIWRRSGSHNSANRYGPIHDTILFYTKSDEYTWNKTYRPYLKGYVAGYFNKKDERGLYRSQTLTGSGTRGGESGQEWRGYDVTSKGRHWAFPGALAEEFDIEGLSQHEKLEMLADEGFLSPTDVDGLPEYRQYLAKSKGVPLQDIWAYQPYTDGALVGEDEAIDQDVKWLEKRGSAERLGYPTQKPEGLLERIIASSSNRDDVVLDPFCGCGTTVHAAQSLRRRWIGIDITIHAVSLVEDRLRGAFKDDVNFVTEGMPTTIEEARALAARDKFQFQGWATYRLGAQWTDKKGADKGIDGRLYFRIKDAEPHRQIIISVKGGTLKATDLRDLRGVVDREKAELGILVSLDSPTRQMRTEASSAGFFPSPWGKHSRLQLITIEELLHGKQIDYPRTAGVNQSFKQPPRAKRVSEKPIDMFDE